MLSLGLSVKSTPTHLLKGELMEALPETDQPNDSTRIALAGIERKNLRLECYMEGIAKLASEDANLLLAISSAGSRYQTYIDRKRLDFGRQIKHGSQVFVELKGVCKKLHGIVWYVGELPTNLGTMFGIELIVSNVIRCILVLFLKLDLTCDANMPYGQVNFFEEFKLLKNFVISPPHQNVVGAS